MTAYLLGAGIFCGAVVSWFRGPGKSSALLAHWFLRIAFALFVVFALSFFLSSEALAYAAGWTLSAILGFFVGGMTQAAGMAFTRGGLGIAGGWQVVLLVLCLWAALLAVVGMSLQS